MKTRNESLTELELGHHMAKEIAQIPAVFSVRVSEAVDLKCRLEGMKSIYTLARGSSDAAANILAYEWMRELQLPVTSIPPSVFSIGKGIRLNGSACLIISQSGASEDLVKSALGARSLGAKVFAITNKHGSALEQAADMIIQQNAGPELAVPATKTVIGSIAAGMAILAAQKLEYSNICQIASNEFTKLLDRRHPQSEIIVDELLKSQHIYVVGRDTGFGAAQEIALKLKECCALHAESYSVSEVMHGPVQLATKPLTVLVLDTGFKAARRSLDHAEDRFRLSGAQVFRISPSDVGVKTMAPAASAAMLLYLVYPIVRRVALSLGFDPDKPDKLSKLTNTR